MKWFPVLEVFSQPGVRTEVDRGRPSTKVVTLRPVTGDRAGSELGPRLLTGSSKERIVREGRKTASRAQRVLGNEHATHA